ncbi:PASTA domain-containing protein [Planobispora siamensis]|uniref:non-specific serine/threonine protein kinase n=1 Tax=Planobispora siamensis TaxID=936338 RepID=A0A8J3SLK4_9ACTN|nr:PASTA domain-containing protein [Planobispora siamensis]GIH96671.1 hypothetical protein Psi01_73010 [Planobispora siamensis]
MSYAQPLKPGDPERLGEYEIVGRLGQGGQGVVYLGVRPAAGPESYAVKLLHDPVVEERETFLREVELAKQVARFCTAQVIEAGLDGDRPYIVSEYVDGPSLHREVAVSGPRTGGGLERLAIGTATALAAIHRAGIVHRDFKPQNVLLGPDGPRVIDFGLARALDAAATQSGRGVGTPAYMAPEQVEGDAISPAADVFSWGATMCFAANGHAPFGQDSIAAVLHRILTAPPELGHLDGWLGALVAACLNKDPGERPTGQELLLALLDDDARSAVLRSSLVSIRSSAFPPVSGAPGPGSSAPGRTGPAGPSGGADADGYDDPSWGASGEHAVVRTHPGRAATRASVAMSGSLLVSAAVLVAVLVPALSANRGPQTDGQQFRPPAATAQQTAPSAQPSDDAVADDRSDTSEPTRGEAPSRTAGPTGGGQTTAPPPAGIAVPALVGLDRSAATRAIKRAGLVPGAVTEADSREPVGRVLRSWPAAGSTAPKGSTVRLEVSGGVRVPQVVGLRRKAAGAALTQAGLALGTVTARCSDQPKGQVLSSTPAGGKRVSAGTAVALVVSRKGGQVPAVVGLSQAKARDVLAAAGFGVRVRARLVADASKDGVVLQQNVAAGSCARQGVAVVITVGVKAQTGPGGDPTPSPDPTDSAEQGSGDAYP